MLIALSKTGFTLEKHFFHQTLLTMSDTYQRATGDEKMTGALKDFSAFFAEQLGLKKH